MKKTITLIIALLSFAVFAQIQGDGETYLTGERIDPTFNGGGMAQFYKYLNATFDFSKVTKAGKMMTAFSITETGEIKNIKVVEFVDMDSAAEMIRILKMAPKWKPATRHGKPISVDMKFPFTIRFKDRDEPEETETPTTVDKKGGANPTDDTAKTASVESKPEFPGGISKFYKYVSSAFIAPESPSFTGGRMIVSFVVEKDGSLVDIKIVKDIGFDTDKEAIRVFTASPKWIPAKQNGIPVRCLFRLPLSIPGNSVKP